MSLEIIEIVNGVLSLVFVIISIILGLKIIKKYFQNKNSNVLCAGIVWLIVCEPWFAISISFLFYLFTSKVLPLEIFFLIGFPLLPLGIFLWLIIFTNFLYVQYRKQILIGFALSAIVIELIFLIFLFTDVSLLGIPVGAIDIMYAPFMLFFLGYLLSIILLTGTRFAYESYKSDNPELRLKGKLFFIAFYFYIFGSIVPIFSMDSIVLLTIAKIILIISAVAFYGGFMLPKWMKSLFLK